MNPLNTCSMCQTSYGFCAYHNVSLTVPQNSYATNYYGTAEESLNSSRSQHLDPPQQMGDMGHELPVCQQVCPPVIEGRLMELPLDDYGAWSGHDDEPWSFLASSLHNGRTLDGYESSTTEHPPSESGPSIVPINQPVGQPSLNNDLSNRRILIPSRNFIDLNDQIWVQGKREDIQDLLSTLGNDLNKRWTEGDDHLCALYALEISLGSLFRNNQFVQLPNFEHLLEILHSDDFSHLASYQAGQVGNREVDNELNSQNNLSVELIFNVLRILGRNMGETFALGICTPANESMTNLSTSPVQIYDVYRVFDLSPPPTATVWIHNDIFDSDGLGSTMNHWSGFGIDPPRVRLPNGDDVYVSNTPYDHRFGSPTPSSTTDSSYYTPESSSFALSQLSSCESRGSNLLPLPDRHPARSSSVDHLARDSTICKSCHKVVQRKSLPKHRETHKELRVKKEKKHQCVSCQQRFHYPKDLCRHISSIHTGDRSFKCPDRLCDYSRTGFTRKDHLQRHLKARPCSTSSVITFSNASEEYESLND